MKRSETQTRPRLLLLPGDQANDLGRLARLFEALTGRRPTCDELAAARARPETDDERSIDHDPSVR